MPSRRVENAQQKGHVVVAPFFPLRPLAADCLNTLQPLFRPFQILGEGEKRDLGAVHTAVLIVLKRVVDVLDEQVHVRVHQRDKEHDDDLGGDPFEQRDHEQDHDQSQKQLQQRVTRRDEVRPGDHIHPQQRLARTLGIGYGLDHHIRRAIHAWHLFRKKEGF